ncbi:MAG: UDP-N-acetylglucosamine 2-epimerase [Armatimonadota bacterium]|nr:UDP-N-acetylglucosamine 2-epimerase [Armatimonadota bacterium]MDR7451998.1 UDP-N-acetylglucosamine 2-epimerase [Armatimonadota bacterium]MDR7467889.1 UDP-N-acetylglucosamine 2-epimerase [Armatimonadota bacterium]MDR7494258.1 UDP-N-acetylglucosamine 2-epimerase [Armatimonadota bacterium]MDR7500039.1 UDP-N-acetylglucosamine 2-epimerase [Armatimonadota bacterium]
MSGGLAVVLGIRPDVIRASLILEFLRERGVPYTFIWSGQHYSDNLKDVFFRQLRVPAPDIELGISAEHDAELVGRLVIALAPVLEWLRPEAAVFLGDTNTVMGCLAAAQLNIPVVHIEGCMRSYDWRMPEEKYRTIVDHLADVIYAYLEEYKRQGEREGLSPERIVVTGNPIVDVLSRYYFGRREHFEAVASPGFFQARGLRRHHYYLMTCHRRENVQDRAALARVLALAGAADAPVYFAASYRTQRMIKTFGLTLPETVILADPIGYEEFLTLMTNSRGVFTDSGTVVEEACILQVPSVQMRRSTERPQVYDVGACVKFDPGDAAGFSVEAVLDRLTRLRGKTWPNPFGDGRASERIVDDLAARLSSGRFAGHRPQDYPMDVSRAYRGDGL